MRLREVVTGILAGFGGLGLGAFLVFASMQPEASTEVKGEGLAVKSADGDTVYAVDTGLLVLDGAPGADDELTFIIGATPAPEALLLQQALGSCRARAGRLQSDLSGLRAQLRDSVMRRRRLAEERGREFIRNGVEVAALKGALKIARAEKLSFQQGNAGLANLLNECGRGETMKRGQEE